MGLRVTLAGTLAAHPGCVHLHLKRSNEPGTLELTHLPSSGELWASVTRSRDAAWINPAITRFCNHLPVALGVCMKPISDLPTLLRELRPTLRKGTYAFCSLPEGAKIDSESVIATFREEEGLSVVLTEELALKAGLSPLFRAEWISLGVCSDLASVGLISAVSRALEQAGIPCNVIAGAFHDHLFVPKGSGKAALKALNALSTDSKGKTSSKRPSKAVRSTPAARKLRK